MSIKKINILFAVLLILPIAIHFILSETIGVNFLTMFSPRNYKTITAPSLPGMTGRNMYEKDSVRDSFYQNVESSISDMREFIKTSYSSNIYSYNHVSELAESVKDLVIINKGRMNTFNSSETYANLYFILPKSTLSDFRKDLKKLTYENLIDETISETNLLSEKISLEREEMSLVKIEEEIKKFKGYAQEIVNDNARYRELIKATESQIANLSVNDPEYKLKLSQYKNEITEYQKSISGGNLAYNDYVNSYTAYEQKLKESKKSLETKKEKFDDKIETVEVRINIAKVSALGYLTKLFPPVGFLFHPLSIYSIIVVFGYWFVRKKFVPAL